MQSSIPTQILALCISVLLLAACGDPDGPDAQPCGVSSAEEASPESCSADACGSDPFCTALAEDSLAPTVEFLSSPTTNRVSYVVEGRITDTHRIASAMIRVDNAPFDRLEIAGSFDQKTFARRIELVEGANRIVVQATDIAGNSAEQAFDVTVTLPVDDTLRADFSAPEDGRVGEPVSFDASSTVAPPDSALMYRWDFGDGDKGAGRRAAHIYDTAGDYVVEVVVADAVSGRSSRHLDLISIAPGTPGERRTVTVAAEVFAGDVPIADAMIVSQGAVVGRTDATGGAQFDVAVADELALSVRADGYAEALRRIPVDVDIERVRVRIELRPLDTGVAGEDPDGGHVFESGGAELRASSGALLDVSGVPVDENIEVSLAPVDPCTDAGLLPDAPAFSLAGEQVTLDARGGAFVDLGSLQISTAPDALVTLTLPICDETALENGQIRAWSLSPSGVWVEQESAQIVSTAAGSVALIELTRGGWWAVGPAYAELHPVDLSCSVAGTNGSGASACSVRVASLDGRFEATRFVRAGETRLELPAGTMVLEAVSSDGACSGTTQIDIPAQTTAVIGLDCYGDQFSPLIVGEDYSGFTVPETEPMRGFRVDGQRGDGLIVDVRYSWRAATGEIRLLDGQRRVLSAKPIEGRSQAGVGFALPFDGAYFIEVELTSGFDRNVDIRARVVPVIDYQSTYAGTFPEGTSQVDHLVWVDPRATALNLFQSADLYGARPEFVDYQGNAYRGRPTGFPSSGPPPAVESGVVELPEGGFWIVRLRDHPTSSLGPGAYDLDVVPVPEASPLQFDAFGRATRDAVIDRAGEHHMFAFDGSAGDGIEASVVGLGDDALERAYDIGLRLWRVGDGTEHGPEEFLREFRFYPHGFTHHLDIFSARLPADDRYVLEVYHYRVHDLSVELGAYTLMLDRVGALDLIVVDDDVSCPGATTRSVLAAGRAAPSGGRVEVCAGEHNIDVPLEIISDDVAIAGAGRDATLIRRHRTIYGVDSAQVAVETRGDGLRISDLAVHARFPRPRSTSTASLIRVWGKSATFENLRIRAEQSNRNWGLTTAGSQGAAITVRGTSFENLAWGANLDAATVVFEDNTLDVRETGVRVQRGVDVVIRGNAQSSGDVCIDSYSTDSVQRFVVESNACVIDGSNVRGMSIQLDIRSAGSGREFIFRGNRVTATGSSARAMHLMPLGPYVDVLVDGNWLEAPNRHALLLGTTTRGSFGRVRVTNNVFANHSGEGAVEVHNVEGFVGIDILHNTFVANPGGARTAVSFYTRYNATGALPVALHHNIFQGDGDDVVVDRRPSSGPFSIDASENLLSSMSPTAFGDFTSTSTWNDTVADAMLLPDTFEPAAGSPAIDALSCTPAVTTDYHGDPRPTGGACDFGAHEN